MKIEIINPNNKNCCGGSNGESYNDDRYYTKKQIDALLQEIDKLLVGDGVPDLLIGGIGDWYIDRDTIRRSLYRKILNSDTKEVSWEFITHINELDDEILEVTQEV